MQEIKSLSQFNKLKASSLLIVDFYAVWCGPCKAISPAFEKISKQHEASTFITFAKCDVDKAKDVAQACGISAMPTFQFFKDGKKVDEVKGADPQQLTTKIGFYTSAAVKENAAGGSTSAGISSQAGASSSGSSTVQNLGSLIDITASKLLNTSNLSNVRNVASPPPAGYAVASVLNPKALIHLVFTQPVSPSLIKITQAKDSSKNAPSRLQVGTNIPVIVRKDQDGVETNDLTMESLSKAENTQAINVYSDEYNNGVAELKLKASKFKGIKSLTIRFDANLSGEDNVISKIGKMDIIGTKA